MSNTLAARRAMVESQVKVNDVTDRNIHEAILATPREAFVPKAQSASAYSDIDVKLGEGRHLMKPRDFAKLLQALQIEADDLVLDIGAASGYASAVLAQLAETVVALESEENWMSVAEKNFASVESDNIVLVQGSLRAGLPDQAPFDVIFVSGAVSATPDSWLQQLADGGRLAVIERNGMNGQAKIYTRSGGVVGSRVIFDGLTPFLCGFEPADEFTF